MSGLPVKDVEHEVSLALQRELQRHPGQWVAIVGEKVVASGRTAKAAYSKAKRAGYAEASIFRVPKPGTSYFF